MFWNTGHNLVHFCVKIVHTSYRLNLKVTVNIFTQSLETGNNILEQDFSFVAVDLFKDSLKMQDESATTGTLPLP